MILPKAAVACDISTFRDHAASKGWRARFLSLRHEASMLSLSGKVIECCAFCRSHSYFVRLACRLRLLPQARTWMDARQRAYQGALTSRTLSKSGWGIVEAILETMSLHPTPACRPPKGVTTRQGLQVLVKYMSDHPEQLHEKTVILAIKAFRQAWPCSQG